MGQKILIVDDDMDIRQTLHLVLDPVCETLEAANGCDALRLIKEEKPSLVLLDISMPEMGGIGILRVAHTLDPTLTVVMLSGHVDLRVAKRALLEGACAYITKPFDVRTLRVEVQRLLDEMSTPIVPYRPWRVRTFC